MQRNARTISLDQKWQSSNGKYEFAIAGRFAPQLKVGEVVRSMTHRGYLLIIGTQFGNVIVFPAGDGNEGQYEVQLSAALARAIDINSTGELGVDDIKRISSMLIA